MIRGAVRFLDERLGAAPGIRKTLRYIFPDHWSFLLGEIALYCFVVLVATGIFLTFFYVPSDSMTTYSGSYEPLQGRAVPEQYHSVLNIALDVPAGNLMRQTHHWAANVFIAAIVLHLIRIILTGAFRKPRELNYTVGVTLLGLAIFEGFAGYSLINDMYSGMGLVIAYAVALSIPFVGGDFSFIVWGEEFPGATEFWVRLEILHVLIVPVLIAALIAIHLSMIVRQHHTQFPGNGRSEVNAIGTPLWPGYALRSIGLFFAVAAVLFLLGGLVQINPVWLWGPYEPGLSTNAAQPDWYLGWLIGGLRLMPPLDVQLGDYTAVPNPFWGGLLFPLAVFAVLYALPWIDRRRWGDRRRHHLLDRPRDNPRRTAFLVALLTWVSVVFAVGSTDRLFFRADIPYEGQIWFWRVASIGGPVIAYWFAKRLCEELRDREQHPLQGWSGRVVRRRDGGGFEALSHDDDGG